MLSAGEMHVESSLAIHARAAGVAPVEALILHRTADMCGGRGKLKMFHLDGAALVLDRSLVYRGLDPKIRQTFSICKPLHIYNTMDIAK